MMPPTDVITGWHWMAFIGCVLFLLALDLGVFHRSARDISFKEALGWTIVWFTLAMAFAWAFVLPQMGKDRALQFVLGYIIELSLSMDNVMVIAVIFAYFGVPGAYQHRVLFWGILGALIMRGAMIWVGVELIQQFKWIMYVLGAFLVYAGIKMLVSEETDVHPEKNPFIRMARKLYPVTSHFEGQSFVTKLDGKRALTPLALVLLMVETTDLIFAVDSIPAIFAVTLDPFVIFTSNVFAILGLRSLYFVLAGAIGYFRYLKIGLSLVLVFIGAKMLLEHWYKISTVASLCVVLGVIMLSMIASVVAARREAKTKS